VRKAGFTTEELYQAVLKKMEINRARKWGPRDENGVCHHIEDPA